MPTAHCPACGNLGCPPIGPQRDLLIIGDAPEVSDLEKGRPFASTTNKWRKPVVNVAHIFRKELEAVGLSLNEHRLTNLWLHAPNKSKDCWQAGYDLALEEAKGKQAILLVGSDVVEVFTGYKVSDVSGLQVTSAVLSAPLIVAMVSPALAMSRGVGEVRFAVSQWKKFLNERGLG